MRSSDAGTMYPLIMKNTSTPYSPGSKKLYTAVWTWGSTRVPKWAYTTHKAAIPRSASSQASLRPPAEARPGGCGCEPSAAGAGLPSGVAAVVLGAKGSWGARSRAGNRENMGLEATHVS